MIRVAIPTANEKLCLHFGHCEKFVLIDVEDKKIISQKEEIPPPHEPGVLPKWLHDLGANVIIAGGMGMRAQSLFAENSIEVIAGAPSLSPAEVVGKWLEDKLECGQNACDH